MRGARRVARFETRPAGPQAVSSSCRESEHSRRCWGGRLMAARSPMVVIHQAHAGIRRSALRRQLQSVASGNSTSLSVDLDQSGADVGAVIEEITNRLPIESMHVQRLVFAFKRSGTADRVVERLAAESPQQRARSARVVGALQLTEAVSWLAALLGARGRAVSDAAAPARGKIGAAAEPAARPRFLP